MSEDVGRTRWTKVVKRVNISLIQLSVCSEREKKRRFFVSHLCSRVREIPSWSFFLLLFFMAQPERIEKKREKEKKKEREKKKNGKEKNHFFENETRKRELSPLLKNEE